jgi:prepilin peptidase CpaA
VTLFAQIHGLVVCLFVAILVAAAAEDVRARTIPNHLTAALVLLYPAHVLAGPTAADWPAAILLALLVIALGMVPFARGWMGGGDVKLLAAAMLWAGPAAALPFLIVTAVAGGGFALVMLGGHRFAVADTCRACGWPDLGDAFLGRDIPYALAIAAGAVAACGPALLGPA